MGVPWEAIMQTLYSVNELIGASENKLSIHTIKDYCRRGELHPCIYFEGNIVCIRDERFQNSIDKRDPVAHIETLSWARTFKGYISASNFIDYITHTDTQASDVFFNVTKIIEHISLTNDFPLLQKDEYLKAFPPIIDDDIQEKRWLYEINDFKGNIFKAHEIVFHVSEIEKLLLAHSQLPKSPVKILNNTGDLGSDNLQKKESLNIKKSINLKDMLKDMDDYISVSSVFELIKERTDLVSDSEVANFLITHKNNLPNPVNKFDYFDGKPTPLYKDFQQKQLTKMDFLLLEIARGELKFNSDDGRLKKFAWEKFDFFWKFRYLTEIGLDEDVSELNGGKENSHQEANNVTQSEGDLLLQDQCRFDNLVMGYTSIEYYQREINQLRQENNKLKGDILEKNALIKELKLFKFGTITHPALDPTNSNHAPELLLAVQVWEGKYINNEYPHQEHTPAIETILKNKGVGNSRLRARLAAITNPKKKI